MWIHLETHEISSVYLKNMLREKFVRDYSSIASGTTFAELKIFALKGLDIMMPPIELQNEFAQFVQQVDKLKFEVQKALEDTQMMFDSLLNEYFG